MEVVIVFGIAAMLGSVITLIITRVRSIGFIRIDTSDPDDGPYLFLELTKDIRTLFNKKYVTVKIKTENFISQK